MPVGTKATVKALHPDEVRALGAHVMLANTYHLHFRPGEDVIEELGGLHAFCGWDGPILTDSGGFQVFSLRDTLLAVDEDGVTFRSVYDGDAGAIHAGGDGRDPAAPRLGHRHVPRRLRSGGIADCGARAGRRSAQRPGPAPGGAPRRRASCASASPRVAPTVSCGAARSTRSSRSPFDGFALGGLAVGESREEMLDTVGWAAPLLPAGKPRYFMGIGDAEGILEVIAARRSTCSTACCRPAPRAPDRR